MTKNEVIEFLEEQENKIQNLTNVNHSTYKMFDLFCTIVRNEFHIRTLGDKIRVTYYEVEDYKVFKCTDDIDTRYYNDFGKLDKKLREQNIFSSKEKANEHVDKKLHELKYIVNQIENRIEKKENNEKN